MRLIKMLGIAVVAALAAMALVGAGTASATAICKNATHPCAEAYANGTLVRAKTAAATLKDSTVFGTTEIMCESVIEGEIIKNPGETIGEVQGQAEGKITKATWTNCTPTGYEIVAVQLPWRFHINHTTEQNGVMWIGPWEKGKEAWEKAPGAETKGVCGGSNCVFHAHETQSSSNEWVQGTIAGGIAPTITFNQVQLRTACGGEGLWSAVYQITEPTPMYISE